MARSGCSNRLVFLAYNKTRWVPTEKRIENRDGNVLFMFASFPGCYIHALTDSDDDQYFLNLALVREATMKAGVPFINVVQACSLDSSHRVPNGNEGRYLAYTTLAYGGQGLSQFVYWTRVPNFIGGGVAEYADGTFNTERAAADAAAPLTPLGEVLREINPEFVAVAEQLQPLISLGVYHSGRPPAGGAVEELPADVVFTADPPFDPRRDTGILWGLFGSSSDHPTCVLVVNLNHGEPITTTIVGPASMEVFDARGRQWHSVSDGSRAQLNLVAGGGKLLRLRPAE